MPRSGESRTRWRGCQRGGDSVHRRWRSPSRARRARPRVRPADARRPIEGSRSFRTFVAGLDDAMLLVLVVLVLPPKIGIATTRPRFRRESAEPFAEQLFAQLWPPA